MIMSNNEISIRLESPLNLINRLRALPEIVSLPNNYNNDNNDNQSNLAVPGLPSINDLIDNPEDKIKLAGIKTAATDALASTVSLIAARVGDTEKPEKLSKIATDMMKVIDTINGDRRESHSNRPVVIFKPMLVNELSFGPIIHVNE